MTREEARAVLRDGAAGMRRDPGGGAFLRPGAAFRLAQPGSDDRHDTEGEFAGPRFVQLRAALAALGYGARPRDHRALAPGTARFDPAWVAALDRDTLDLWVVWAGRGERFCTGFDADLVRRGLYVAAAERALVLTQDDG